MNMPLRSFANFTLEVGKMGGATSLKSPKLKNGQFSSERADFLRAEIFLHHMNIPQLSFANFTLKVGKM